MGERGTILGRRDCDFSQAVVAARGGVLRRRSHRVHTYRDLIVKADFVHQDEPNKMQDRHTM
jgi:hypothetical protein